MTASLVAPTVDEMEGLLARVESLERKRFQCPSDDIKVDEPMRRARAAVEDGRVYSSVWKWVPADYYQRSLNERAVCLGAPTINQLCKSLLLENKKASTHADPTHPQFVLVVLQYAATLDQKALTLALRRLRPVSERLDDSKFDFRLASAEDNEAITGYPHNSVTPFGLRQPGRVVMMLSEEVVPLKFFWMGGGHVHLKLGMSVADFISSTKCLVGKVSQPRTALELKSMPVDEAVSTTLVESSVEREGDALEVSAAGASTETVERVEPPEHATQKDNSASISSGPPVEVSESEVVEDSVPLLDEAAGLVDSPSPIVVNDGPSTAAVVAAATVPAAAVGAVAVSSVEREGDALEVSEAGSSTETVERVEPSEDTTKEDKSASICSGPPVEVSESEIVEDSVPLVDEATGLVDSPGPVVVNDGPSAAAVVAATMVPATAVGAVAALAAADDDEEMDDKQTSHTKEDLSLVVEDSGTPSAETAVLVVSPTVVSSAAVADDSTVGEAPTAEETSTTVPAMSVDQTAIVTEETAPVVATSATTDATVTEDLPQVIGDDATDPREANAAVVEDVGEEIAATATDDVPAQVDTEATAPVATNHADEPSSDIATDEVADESADVTSANAAVATSEVDHTPVDVTDGLDKPSSAEVGAEPMSDRLSANEETTVEESGQPDTEATFEAGLVVEEAAGAAEPRVAALEENSSTEEQVVEVAQTTDTLEGEPVAGENTIFVESEATDSVEMEAEAREAASSMEAIASSDGISTAAAVVAGTTVATAAAVGVTAIESAKEKDNDDDASEDKVNSEAVSVPTNLVDPQSTDELAKKPESLEEGNLSPEMSIVAERQHQQDADNAVPATPERTSDLGGQALSPEMKALMERQRQREMEGISFDDVKKQTPTKSDLTPEMQAIIERQRQKELEGGLSLDPVKDMEAMKAANLSPEVRAIMERQRQKDMGNVAASLDPTKDTEAMKAAKFNPEMAAIMERQRQRETLALEQPVKSTSPKKPTGVSPEMQAILDRQRKKEASGVEVPVMKPQPSTPSRTTGGATDFMAMMERRRKKEEAGETTEVASSTEKKSLKSSELSSDLQEIMNRRRNATDSDDK